MTRIEHANITVPSIDAAIEFLQIVAPDFRVRKDVTPEDSYRWAHIGNDNHYFALQEVHSNAEPRPPRKSYLNYGVNHIGLIVDNLDEIERKLMERSYRRSIDTSEETFRKRRYFFDRAGFEWELVEYHSEIPEERYLYE